MLTGRLTYTFNGKQYFYNVSAIDTSENLAISLTSGSYDAMSLLQGTESDTFREEVRCDIKAAKILVDTIVTKNNNGKNVKVPVNNDFFCRLGALLRYAKNNCITKNLDGFIALQLASGEFSAKTDKEYHIPFPTSKNEFATVKTAYDEITELKLKTDDFEITLKNNAAPTLFPAVKANQAISLGFKFDEEYLGFPFPVVEPPKVDSTISYALYKNIDEIIAAHPDKEFRWLLEKDYRIVTDDTLEEVCNYIMNWDGYVYYDTETTGLNINFLSRTGQADQLVGVVLSVKYGESFFFPTQMKSIPNLCGGDHFYFMERYMRPILETKKLVAHNAPFDWKVAYIYDINANIVHDTLIMLQLTFGTKYTNYKVGLKANTKSLLGRDALELSDLLVDGTWGKNNEIKFWDLPYELVRLYACADTDDTNGLLQYMMQNNVLEEYGATKIYEIELAFSYAVAYQEFYGHLIDIKHIEEIKTSIHKEQKELMEQMVEIAGHTFNPNSPAQLQNVMYNELKIPTQIDRASGKVTTGKEALKYLAELTDAEDNAMYPFAQIMVKYRELEGVRKIVDKMPEYLSDSGYIFSEVKQFGASTGRVSITAPNYQSYNDPIKKNVIPRPGYWMFDTDYSSVEYRVLGNMVGNKKIMESFKDPDFDYHQYQAARMYGVPYATVTKKMRKAAKGINFGLPYGMADESLGVRVFGEASPENTRKAAALRASYFKGQEDIRDWFEFHRDKGVNLGYTETYFGRRRYYNRATNSVGRIRRQAGNQVIQGCQDLNTRILTKEFGIVKLGDVLNLNLTIWDGKNWSNGDVLPAGKKQKTIIKFKGGQTMICSPTHKFLVATKRGNTMWVEAKDLHTTSEYRNPHRIVVNQKYAISDCIYKSERIYDSTSNNSHNVYLDDINDSYGIGVFLGRLASDGHQTIQHKGSNAVIQIIAEHEFNILPELREYMSALGYIENDKDVRTDRNEAITNLTVYSTSLCKEIHELDIRHKIHKNIFMDTEVLRGFLCGYFDGAGGISGKTITCVFGKQDNFRILVEDMQKALMFFGIRSRIREYDDRYVLQIKTNDNDVFLQEIGFLNEDKQKLGLTLKCIEEEKTFGKCIIPESVEVTDEWIPMADVCNTDGGFYVADGIITHNTAADIYKTAVGNVFKRICAEGWLGKVLFTGFIHDELLGEVSNDINPGVFLKVLREEFEVVVHNDDGTPWCPLYMGFGYGMSWYEAKSVELPIKLQWEIVEKYGETGFPDWTGDGRQFCDTIPERLRDFDVRDIRNQLLDKESQGKEIKTTLNSQMFDCLKTDKKAYDRILKEAVEKGKTGEEIVAELNAEYIQFPLVNPENNTIIMSFDIPKDTQDAITLWCKLHATDRSQINIENLPTIDTENADANIELNAETITDDENNTYTRQEAIDCIIDSTGRYIDTEKKEITMLYPNEAFLRLIQSKVVAEPTSTNDFILLFRDTYGIINPNEKGRIYETNKYIPNTEMNFVSDVISKWISIGCPTNTIEDRYKMYQTYGYCTDKENNTLIIQYRNQRDIDYLSFKHFVTSDSPIDGYTVYMQVDNPTPVLYDLHVKLPYMSLGFLHALYVNRFEILPELNEIEKSSEFHAYLEKKN